MKLSGTRKTSSAFTKANDEFLEGLKSIVNFLVSMVNKNSLISGEFFNDVKYDSSENPEAETLN